MRRKLGPNTAEASRWQKQQAEDEGRHAQRFNKSNKPFRCGYLSLVCRARLLQLTKACWQLQIKVNRLKKTRCSHTRCQSIFSGVMLQAVLLPWLFTAVEYIHRALSCPSFLRCLCRPPVLCTDPRGKTKCASPLPSLCWNQVLWSQRATGDQVVLVRLHP